MLSHCRHDYVPMWMSRTPGPENVRNDCNHIVICIYDAQKTAQGRCWNGFSFHPVCNSSFRWTVISESNFPNVPDSISLASFILLSWEDTCFQKQSFLSFGCSGSYPIDEATRVYRSVLLFSRGYDDEGCFNRTSILFFAMSFNSIVSMGSEDRYDGGENLLH